MSATAFQRLRREAETGEPVEANVEEIKELTVKELKVLLDEKGIEYDSKAKKDDLIKLLEGAE